MPLELTVDDEIKLRSIRREDAQKILSLIQKNKKHLKPYHGNITKENPTVDAVIENFTDREDPDEKKFGIWKNEQLVGHIYISMQENEGLIGYFLDENYQGQRIITRAVGKVLLYSFNTLGAQRIYAEVRPGNLASKAVLFACGFTVAETEESFISYIKTKE